MLSWLANAWRVPELRRRLLFTAVDPRPLPPRAASSRRRASTRTQITEYFGKPGRHGARPAQPLLGQRALALLALRARDHAVHHGLDHPAADGGRRADARPAPEGGRGRLREDQPVHALPDDRPRRRAGDRLLVPLPPAGHPDAQHRPARPDRGHAHRRDDAADVDGRADHEAGRRQRDLVADLRLDHRPLAARGPRLDRRRADDEALLPAARDLRDRRGRLHPGGAAPDPDPVREAPGRPANDGRRVDLPTDAREHGRA